MKCTGVFCSRCSAQQCDAVRGMQSVRCSCVRAHRPRALRLPLEALGMARAKDGPGSRTGPSTTSDTKLCPAMRLDRTLGGSASQRRDSHRCTPSNEQAANGQQGTSD